ncbi:MAG: AAA family ATPase, partial [Actinomycetota bacterium]|nr:AAA family ATPase [Actinomycetota bacterium]
GDELHRLECRLDDAMAGRGGLALVSGEAGTGKTVLMRALAVGARARMSRLVTVEGRCDAHWGAGDPFLPFRQVLATLSGDEEQPVVADVSSPERVAEVTTCVIEAIVEDGPYLLGTLVDVDALDARARAALGESPLAARLAAATANARLRATDPTRQQRPVLDQCVHVLRRVAGSAPLLLLVDDLQWADHATIDLLFRLARGLAGVPVLVVGAFRPEELDGSGDGPHPLRRLARELELEGAIDPVVLDSRPGFVDAWLDREPNALGEDFRVRLRAFTGGHPLATVELVGAMIERGELRRDASSRWVVASDPDWRSVPPRIEAMIGSRLDRLPPGVRATLEAASVQGDEFTVEVLAAATGERAVDITREVAHLAEQDHPLVVSVGTERLDGALLQRYRFRHVLFQRHLYDAMPTPERVALHDATARALEATHAGHEDAVAIELASHFDAAQAVDEAINYHGLAARQAMVRVADAEAVGHLERALALLDTERPDRDDEPDGIARRLELLSALASCLQTHDGWTAPRPAAVWERIRDLCDRAGPTMEAAQALGALIAFDELRGHYAEALAGAAHLRDISEQLGLPFLASVGWMQAGMVHPLVGRPVDADVCLRRALELYDPERDGWLTYVVGQDVEVTSRAWSALVHWHLGRFDRSRREADAAIARARVIGHPTSLAFALGVAGGLVANTRGDFEGSSEAMAELADLAEREDLAFYRATALVHGGLAHGTLGDPVAGAAEIGRGIDAWTAIGTVAYVAWSSTTRAQLLIDAGRLDEAAAVLDAVEVQVDTGEEQIALQRMWFMRGRLRRAQGDRAGAQEAFRRAVAIAASWRAIGLQVEASNALAELLDRRR